MWLLIYAYNNFLMRNKTQLNFKFGYEAKGIKFVLHLTGNGVCVHSSLIRACPTWGYP